MRTEQEIEDRVKFLRTQIILITRSMGKQTGLSRVIQELAVLQWVLGEIETPARVEIPGNRPGG